MRPTKTWNLRWPALDETVHFVAMALGTTLYAAALWAFLNGPRLHAEAEQRMAAETEAESRDVCRRLGMPPDSDLYTACAVELSRVRYQHDDRAVRRTAGLP